MPRKSKRATSVPKAAAVRDDILACEAELKKLKRLYKLVLELEGGIVKPSRPVENLKNDFYQGAPVGLPALPVPTDDDED